MKISHSVLWMTISTSIALSVSVFASNVDIEPSGHIERDEAGGAAEFKKLDKPLVLVATKTQSDALPGQKIILKHVVCLPPGKTVTTWEWTVAGVIFKDYVANQGSATLSAVDPFNSQTITYYWTNHGQHAVKATATLNDGAKIVCDATFSVEEPPSTLTASTGAVALNANKTQIGLFPNNGNPACNGNGYGIVYKAKVEVPANWPQGKWNLVQLVIPDRNWKRDGDDYKWSLNGTEVLDSLYPYQHFNGSFPTGAVEKCDYDSPSEPLQGTEVWITKEDFRIWTTFIPPGDEVKEVPLKVLSWHWGGKTSKANGVWGNPVNTVSGSGASASTTEHPKWTANVANGVEVKVNP